MDVVKAVLNAGWRSPWTCEVIYEENKYEQGGIWVRPCLEGLRERKDNHSFRRLVGITRMSKE